jgi:hypothetical protein
MDNENLKMEQGMFTVLISHMVGTRDVDYTLLSSSDLSRHFHERYKLRHVGPQ